jgi:hypothetical protein
MDCCTEYVMHTGVYPIFRVRTHLRVKLISILFDQLFNRLNSQHMKVATHGRTDIFQAREFVISLVEGALALDRLFIVLPPLLAHQ